MFTKVPSMELTELRLHLVDKSSSNIILKWYFTNKIPCDIVPDRYKTNKHQLIDLMAGVIIRMCSINEIYTPKHFILILGVIF